MIIGDNIMIINDHDYNCPLELTRDIIGGKWALLIIWNLSKQTMRFNELKRAIPYATQKMMTQHLRKLESFGIVHREVYPQVPPKVEYWLTDTGRSLLPVLEILYSWGTKYMKDNR